jgi:3-oxoacyl-[acyl-carrier-protein] synthase-3
LILSEVGYALGELCIEPAQIINNNDPNRIKILEKTGFKNIYRTKLSSAELAFDACKDLPAEVINNIDLVMCVSSVLDSAPSIACQLHAKLGLESTASYMQLQDACTGFTRSIELCENLLKIRAYKNILLVVVDTYTQYYNENELHLSCIFSDAASAYLVSENNKFESYFRNVYSWEIVESKQNVNSKAFSALGINTNETTENRLFMNGSAVFQYVSGNIKKVIDELSINYFDKIDNWFIHQGSLIAVESVSSQLPSREKNLFRASEIGNTVGSSIPFQVKEYSFMSEEIFGMVTFGMGLNIHGLLIKSQVIKSFNSC